AVVEIEHSFDLSSLNGPLSGQALSEIVQNPALLQISTLVIPKLQERAKVAIGEGVPILWQIGDWFSTHQPSRPPGEPCQLSSTIKFFSSAILGQRFKFRVRGGAHQGVLGWLRAVLETLHQHLQC